MLLHTIHEREKERMLLEFYNIYALQNQNHTRGRFKKIKASIKQTIIMEQKRKKEKNHQIIKNDQGEIELKLFPRQ